MGRKSKAKERIDDPVVKLEWASELFKHYSKKGLKEVRADDAAKILKKSKASIYAYFRSRDEIIETIINHKIKTIPSYLEFLLDDTIAFEIRHKKMMDYVGGEFTVVSDVFYSDLTELYPKFAEVISKEHAKFFDDLKRFYDRAIESGVVVNTSGDYLVLLTKSLIEAIGNSNMQQSKELTIEKILDLHHNLIINATVSKVNAENRLQDPAETLKPLVTTKTRKTPTKPADNPDQQLTIF